MLRYLTLNLCSLTANRSLSTICRCLKSPLFRSLRIFWNHFTTAVPCADSGIQRWCISVFRQPVASRVYMYLEPGIPSMEVSDDLPISHPGTSGVPSSPSPAATPLRSSVSFPRGRVNFHPAVYALTLQYMHSPCCRTLMTSSFVLSFYKTFCTITAQSKTN